MKFDKEGYAFAFNEGVKQARTMTPVSERLPDCAVDVIAWDGFDFARAWVNAKGEWCSNESLTDFCTGTVTHWMPEPEIPR